MLNKLFSLKGRINRSLYWFIPILSWFLYDAPSLITSSITNNFPLQISLLLIVCLFAWVFLAQSIKRAHDIGKSGWYLWIPFFTFYLIFEKGDVGENKFGKEPL